MARAGEKKKERLFMNQHISKEKLSSIRSELQKEMSNDSFRGFSVQDAVMELKPEIIKLSELGCSFSEIRRLLNKKGLKPIPYETLQSILSATGGTEACASAGAQE